MTTSQPDLAVAADWQAIVSGTATLELKAASAGHIPALQMIYDFKGGGGFVVARRSLVRAMPAEYAVTFRLRGRGPVNNLELKLVDAGGQNVWRHVMKDLRLPARWTRMTVESREIDFAWGPSSGSKISQLGSVEIAVVAGEGGTGTLWITGLKIEDRTPTEAPRISASSEIPGFEAAGALGNRGWKPNSDDPRPWITIDFVEPRMFGGLVIDWLAKAPARGFRIRASMSGRRWKAFHAVSRAGGTRSNVYLPELKTRFLRLELGEPSVGAALRPQAFDFSRSIHAFWYNVVAAEARGWHPRWLHREQSLWTPTGTDHGVHCALINDDGMVEIDQGSFSLEPMLFVGGRLVTWTDAASRQELPEGWMPMPAVIWETQDWRLVMRAEATVSGHVRVRYQIENRTAQIMSARLFVVIRPFQVTPPWQSFRKVGGVSRIHDLEWQDGAVLINETAQLVPSDTAQFGAMCFDDGFIGSHLLEGSLPHGHAVHDAFGFATAALQFDLSLEPQQRSERMVNYMPHNAARALDAPAFDWSGRLAVAQWAGTGWIGEVIRAALTATAHVLVTRSGPALQPGPRRYTRSWIRDGAMMSAALLRMRHLDEVREFIRWYAPHQRADGFVPCCIDGEGIDWLVEHDSHGQLIALIADYLRFSGDTAFSEECWPFVDKAVGCIERLLGPDGLLPVSVSHEGYLAQPVHSYWDDFWALRGLRDAVELARNLRRQEAVMRWEPLAQRFAESLFTSIEATRAQRGLNFIPGSIEWADFDPTATANALYLLDVPAELNRSAVEQTFDTYLADWRNKRSGAVAWSNYTPYEIRIIGALVRLGRRDAALELLKFFLSDRRPLPWNQWPEIAWQDHKAPAHVGDLPHTWISAEYVLAVRCLFAYERETDDSLVLAAGLAPEWIEGSGVRVTDMPTRYGALRYTLRRIDSATLRCEIGSFAAVKVLLRPPLAAPIRSVTVNGRPVEDFDGDSVTILQTPADILCVTE